eukprot:TRINITY_DN10265_c0_g1_i1.p1 TRINITY_DN10265_c0_g1~~TRINITY_DN10265_c0_g1_i1.p1  ORF type:complete len:459 (-),score=103.35 TRINITY_DN10265_c0_g1_i1:25-1401(-)
MWDEIQIYLTNHPYVLVSQVIMIVWVIYLYTIKSYKIDREVVLSQKEIEELIQDWKPEPLIPCDSHKDDDIIVKAPVIEGGVSSHVIVDGTPFVNFGTYGYLDYQVHDSVKEVAIDCTDKYGVGSCGPRGFYGSIEPHEELEVALAEFMNTEDAVIFGSNFQTIASIIPAHVSVGDFVIIDRGVNLAIQNGALLSRSEIRWFKHNDINDLKRILDTLTVAEVFSRKKSRVYLVVESIYTNYGDMAPLDKLMELKEKYPFRIILEESNSIGVLGATGRGLTEHYNINIADVEIISASLASAIGGIGGFSCGSKVICKHQRLNCSGYVFSASIPPYAAAGAAQAIKLLSEGVETRLLQSNIKFMHELLRDQLSEVFDNSSSEYSPLIHLRYPNHEERESQALYADIVREVQLSNIIISHSIYVKQEKFAVAPSLRICVSAGHSQEELEAVVSAIKSAAKI